MIRFGVNYVPRKDWFFSWNHPDLRATEEDFAVIRSLGFDHIRLHLRWDIFQRSDHLADEESIGLLKQMLDLAQKSGLDVQVTVFNGWMSGVWFLPPFLKERHIICDSSVREAERYLLGELAAAVGKHPALLGVDLGNEINVYGLLQKPFSLEQGDLWLKEMTETCDRSMPGKFHVVGVDHNPWFGQQAFTRKALAKAGSATSLHTWVGFTGALQKFGNLSEETLSLAEFNIEFANAYAEQNDRPVWIQEFGAPVCWYKPDEAVRYVRETVLRAMRSRNLWGFTWWCSHDIERTLDCFDPLEYDLGLIGTDNRVKPLGKVFSELVSEIRSARSVAPSDGGRTILIGENEKGMDCLAAYGKLLRRGEYARFALQEKDEELRAGGAETVRLRDV